MNQNKIILIDNRSLLVINDLKGLIRLRTPFKVICIEPVGKILKDDVHSVYLLCASAEYRLLYQITGQFYPYKYFMVLT